MKYVKDICKIGDDHTVSIDEDGIVTLITGRGIDATLMRFHASDAFSLKEFLERNQALLSQATHISSMATQIRVWTPAAAERSIPDAYHYLLSVMRQHAGQLFHYGTLAQYSTFYYGGYSEDKRVFVLVPDDIRSSYYRECLVTTVGQMLHTDDEHSIAAYIERAQEDHDPDSGQVDSAIAQATDQARLVAYWLALAGDKPLVFDERDARLQTAKGSG